MGRGSYLGFWGPGRARNDESTPVTIIRLVRYLVRWRIITPNSLEASINDMQLCRSFHDWPVQADRQLAKSSRSQPTLKYVVLGLGQY